MTGAVEVFHPGTRLYTEHYRELVEGSGIAPAVVAERGYRTIMGAQELRDLGYSEAQARAPGILLPGHALNGSEAAHDYKPDHPRTDSKGRPVKYERPPGAHNAIDCPPSCREWVRDPSRRLVFTEGKKKADAAASHGVCCLDLSGVYNFKGKNPYGGSEPIPDLEYLPLKGPDGPRDVLIVFDSDASRNRNVRDARKRFAALLRNRGAHVLYLPLPDLPDGSKCGLDDYLLTHSVDELFALAMEPDDLDGGKRSQADALTAAAASGCELWHGPDGEPYADVWIGARRETWMLRSRAFRQWLAHEHYRREGKTPNAAAIEDALRTLEGRARFEGPEHSVHTRLAPDPDGSIWLDLGDRDWRMVRIAADGWQVVASAATPMRFRRSAGMLPLPMPQHGGTLADLWRFANVAKGDRPLVLAWLLAALRPTGPYPVLALSGEQGTAKSTTSRVLRELTDPNRAELRAEPRDERDLVIAANNGHVIALDNLSRVQPWLSDALCRLATGGGFATRALYSDADEIIFDAQRPIIVNGIEELATRSDLLDRAIVLHLPPVTDAARRTEAELWHEFEKARPSLLGVLLDAVAAALSALPAVRLVSMPRMADFAWWAVAGERALGLEPGSFLQAYEGNRADANALALEGSPVAAALTDYMDILPPEGDGARVWSGTARELLEGLEGNAGDATKRLRSWPSTPKGLSGALTRLAPNLRKTGIDVTTGERRGHGGRRTITIRKVPETAAPPSPSSPNARNTSKDAGLDGDAMVTVGGDGDARVTVAPASIVTTQLQAGRGVTATGDDGDGRAASFSEQELLARYNGGVDRD